MKLNAAGADCRCGSADCDAAAGLYCDESIDTCRPLPYCSETNGDEKNLQKCLCDTKESLQVGASTSTEPPECDSKYYCDTSSNTCSTVSSCNQIDGNTPNDASCQCGSSICTLDSGLHCYKASSTCSRLCSNVDGSTSNLIQCKCGSTRCSISDGLHCDASINTCRDFPTCSQTKGDLPNAAHCLCGSAECQSTSGYYCDASNSTGSCRNIPLCTDTDGGSLNVPDASGCQCGTSECTTSSGFYCYESINTCSLTEPCIHLDGTIPNDNLCQCGPTECTKKNGLYCDITITEGSTCFGTSTAADCGSSSFNISDMEKCAVSNARCKCVRCKKGYYSSDCTILCPDPAVSILVDSTFLLIVSWIFLAYLYFSNRHIKKLNEIKDIQDTGKKTNKKTSAAASRGSKALNTDAVQQMKENVKSLQRLLVSRMQIITAILSSITWSPAVPKFLIDILTFIATVFTVNVPGLLTSPDCVGVTDEGGMASLNKWFISMFVPFGILVVFGIWYFSLRRDSTAKNAVKDAGIQVFFVWLFETIVTTTLKVFDCDWATETQSSKLIMDPNEECPLEGHPEAQVWLAYFGMFVLFSYVFLPYLWLIRMRSPIFCCCCWIRKDSPCDDFFYGRKDSNSFSSVFGWALKNYKEEFQGWELWNVMNRTCIIIGSTVMYAENRFYTHITVMIWSLLLHCRYRPYKNRDSNIAAILFCVCDILGAVSAFLSWLRVDNPEFIPEVSAGLQIVFVIVTFITLLIIVRFIVRAVRKQSISVQAGLKNKDTNGMFASYTPMEKKLLFPILGFVWIVVKLYQKCYGKKYASKGGTKVVPKEEKKEDNEDEMEENDKIAEGNEEKTSTPPLLEDVAAVSLPEEEVVALIGVAPIQAPVQEEKEEKEEKEAKEAKEAKAKTEERKQDLSDVRNWGMETNATKAQSILKKSSKQVFKDCDADGDGALDATEVRKALAALGCQMKDDAFNKMFQDCDKDKNGSINYKEFKKKL
jgi:hypothetical protein